MADVQTLRGIRYSSDTVGDLAQVVTPPYDVISEEDQARYYARSPYNIIRLELGKEETGDTSINNRYTRAAAIFGEWRINDILRQEATPCYYLYQQIFNHDGQTYTHEYAGAGATGTMERKSCATPRDNAQQGKG